MTSKQCVIFYNIVVVVIFYNTVEWGVLLHISVTLNQIFQASICWTFECQDDWTVETVVLTVSTHLPLSFSHEVQMMFTFLLGKDNSWLYKITSQDKRMTEYLLKRNLSVNLRYHRWEGQRSLFMKQNCCVLICTIKMTGILCCLKTEGTKN